MNKWTTYVGAGLVVVGSICLYIGGAAENTVIALVGAVFAVCAVVGALIKVEKK